MKPNISTEIKDNNFSAKIIVATHKKYWMPKSDIYMPVQAGSASHADLGYHRDNTGDNISEKNPYYCELTCIYWAYKNFPETISYIGLSHYRRHFTVKNFLSRLISSKKQSVLSEEHLKNLIAKNDIILPKKRHYYIESNRSHYNHAHNPEDLKNTGKIIETHYPEYMESFEKVMNQRSAHMFNMFIMKKNIFEAYCTWLFDILYRLEKITDLSDYDTYESRVYGYISELLLDVYIEFNNLPYKEIPFIFLDNQNWFLKIKNFLKRKLNGGPFKTKK